jgi:hypothetical protein
MTAPTGVDDETARSVFRTLAGAEWSWTADEAEALADRLGWTVARRTEDAVVARTAWQLPDPTVSLLFGEEDDVTSVWIPLTPLDEDEPAGRALVDQEFARFAALAVAELGEPTLRRPGAEPTIRWRGDTATLLLSASSSAVTLMWVSNTFQDEQDALQPWDGDLDDDE